MRVWSATWCVPCKQVKAWLARNPDVLVQLMDVDKDKPPSDIRTVPTLETDDGQFIRGPSEIIKFLQETKQ